MKVIQISNDDFTGIGENIEKMLRYGGKAMQQFDELQQKHGMGGGMRDDDDDDDDDPEREMEEFKRWKRMKKMRGGQRENYSVGQRNRRRESGGGMRDMREMEDPYFEV